ncbi:MAG: glycoside hydrolase N-terminal domain-containing protein [Verrucomicrobia bacterium]|nr:glycoside hydrolase N-terminal domain-containing protein [Verrucomicrobiota bacterium]
MKISRFLLWFHATLFLLGVTASAESTLWYRTPASEWREALPVGNGRIGAISKSSCQLEKQESPTLFLK